MPMAAGSHDAGTPPEVAPAVRIVRFRAVPAIHPFRALRYAAEHVPDLASVIAPPYDVIDPADADHVKPGCDASAAPNWSLALAVN